MLTHKPQAFFSRIALRAIMGHSMPHKFKVAYQRAQVQFPEGIYAWLQQRAGETKSISQVAIEAVAEAMQLGDQSAAELKAADVALHHAERLARDWMFAAPEKKEAAIRTLVEHLLSATRRSEYPETGDDARQVAEDAAVFSRALRETDKRKTEQEAAAKAARPHPNRDARK